MQLVTSCGSAPGRAHFNALNLSRLLDSFQTRVGRYVTSVAAGEQTIPVNADFFEKPQSRREGCLWLEVLRLERNALVVGFAEEAFVRHVDGQSGVLR